MEGVPAAGADNFSPRVVACFMLLLGWKQESFVTYAGN
jgi:hypothetical protein